MTTVRIYRRALPVLLLFAIALGSDALAQPPNAGRDLAEASRWPTEIVELSDGRQLPGLIESETAKELVFVELHRPQGKPMYLVIRHLDRDWVKSIRRLDKPQRDELRKRIDRFRNWSRIEAGRLDNVALQTVERMGTSFEVYSGDWFTLSSTAEDETTRRSVVRVEQVFAAYRRILPPRHTPQRKLAILLFGSTDEYRTYLKANDLPIENPSFYAADRNLVVTGSDLKRYTRQLAKVRARHSTVLKEYQQFSDQLPELLARLTKEMQQNGVSDEERAKVLKATRRNWEDELAAVERKIKVAERTNEAQFNAVTQQMFVGLSHEAFHAYLENFVYPQAKHDVPRWLNEGLAQVFESGLLEDETLRLDAPPAKRLAQLQADLKGSEPLPLAKLLTADEKSFLILHSSAAGASDRHYLYSWGLSYYLTFIQPVWDTAALDAYVDLKQKDALAVARFEKLVGMPLAEFERHWRREMLTLKATGEK